MECNKYDNFGGTIGIQLSRLNNVETVEYKGKRCVVIPIEENGIYTSDRGTLVLSLFMARMPEPKWGKTHTVKRKLTGDEYKNMTRQQRDKHPVIGYFEPYGKKENTLTQFAQQQQHTQQRNGNKVRWDDISDLPW